MLVQVSGQPLAWKAASLIKKETLPPWLVSYDGLIKNERRTSNIERPTSNNAFCQFKKDWAKRIYSSKLCGSVFGGSLVIKSIKRSVINIQRSMLNVRCSTFNLFTVPATWSFIWAFKEGLQSFNPERGTVSLWTYIASILQPWTGNGEPLNLYRFNPLTLNGQRWTFEPISLQSFNPERTTVNLWTYIASIL